MTETPLAFLPLGIRLADRLCVVVGGGRVGARKITTLLRARATILLVAPEALEELRALAAQGRISWAREAFQAEHLAGAFLAVAATDDPEVNQAVVREAESLRILACDASAGERSDVIFGALHQEEDFLLAVFTDGRDPARAREARDKMAAILAGVPSPTPLHAGARHERYERAESPPRPLLVLVAHGSPDREWQETLERLARLVREKVYPQEVAVAYIQSSHPTLLEVVEEAMARGLRHFRFLPLFMAAAGHVEKDVVPLVRAMAAANAEAEFVLLPPLGEDPRLAEFVAALAGVP